ncbi:MAG: suppressor of fused domain protein [Methyloligellaceae bacterium]
MLRIEDYSASDSSFEFTEDCEEIQGHVERHIGPVEMLCYEQDPDTVRVDILIVPATSDRNFHYLVTSGMSSLPMLADPQNTEVECWHFSELVMALPGDWPLFDAKKMQNDRWNFPIRHLNFLSRMPHKYDTWLSVGHSIPNFESKKRITSDCEVDGFIIDHPVLGGENFRNYVTREGKNIHFCGLYPVYSNEMQYKLRKGFSALSEIFRKNNLTEIFYPERPCFVRNSIMNWLLG